jgi:hypothetical protein
VDSKFQFPRQIGSGFEASVGLGPIDRRRGGIIRAVVGLGKPIELFRRLKEPPMNAPTLLAVARHRGTGISNPPPSSGKSANFRFLASIIRLTAGGPYEIGRVFQDMWGE